MIKLFFPVWALLMVCPLAQLEAVPPPPGSPQVDFPVCRTNRVALNSNVQRLKSAPFFSSLSTKTTAYVIVVRVDFSDKSMSNSRADAEAFMEKVKNFYLENSYDLLYVSATVTTRTSGGSAGSLGAYRMSKSLATYAQGICSNYSDIAKDALSAASTDYNLSTGAPGGNAFHHIMVYHAGIGAETAGDSGCQTNNFWSVYAPTVAASAANTEGVQVPFQYNALGSAVTTYFNGVTIVPESEDQNIDPLGVICHEYGHQLGLPDLYKTSAQSVVGEWSLMDGGIYIGTPLGSNPAHLDAWSKKFLGFSSPRTISPSPVGTYVSLGYALTGNTAFLRIPVGSSSSEYCQGFRNISGVLEVDSWTF